MFIGATSQGIKNSENQAVLVCRVLAYQIASQLSDISFSLVQTASRRVSPRVTENSYPTVALPSKSIMMKFLSASTNHLSLGCFKGVCVSIGCSFVNPKYMPLSSEKILTSVLNFGFDLSFG